jgi:hypothetical protein
MSSLATVPRSTLYCSCNRRTRAGVAGALGWAGLDVQVEWAHALVCYSVYDTRCRQLSALYCSPSAKVGLKHFRLGFSVGSIILSIRPQYGRRI